MPLMSIQEYRETEFTEKSQPSFNTVKAWIRNGVVYGKKIGGKWYVDPTKDVLFTDNELVLKVLRSK